MQINTVLVTIKFDFETPLALSHLTVLRVPNELPVLKNKNCGSNILFYQLVVAVYITWDNMTSDLFCHQFRSPEVKSLLHAMILVEGT